MPDKYILGAFFACAFAPAAFTVGWVIGTLLYHWHQKRR